MSDGEDKGPGEFQLCFFADGEADFLRGKQDESAARYHGVHSGMTTKEREELCRWALDVYVSSGSERCVAETCGVSRNTVAALVEDWEREGRVEPLKRRVAGKLQTAARLGLEYWTDALRAGQIPPSTLPVAVGIFLDKSLLLSGEPTAIVAGVGSSQPSVEDLRRYLASLPSAQVEVEPAQVAAPVPVPDGQPAIPSDSQSDVPPTQPQ